jgi:hypothetical protein
MKNKLINLVVALSITMSSVSNADDYSLSPDPEEAIDINVVPKTTTLTFPEIPEIPESEPDVGEAISPMKRWQRAPFTGLLLSPRAIASIMYDLQEKQDLIEIEVNKVTKKLNLLHNHEISILKIRNESDSKIDKLRIEEQKKEIEKLDLQIKKERESRPDPLLWASIGAGAGIVLTTLTAAVIVSVGK